MYSYKIDEQIRNQIFNRAKFKIHRAHQRDLSRYLWHARINAPIRSQNQRPLHHKEKKKKDEHDEEEELRTLASAK